MTDIIIIGAGPAGLTAAIYAARAGMSVTVFDKNAYGGQIALTSQVDNYPGLQGIDGVEFATNLYSHAVAMGAEVRFEEVQAVELDGEVKKLTASGKVYEGRSVILANGAARRRIGAPGEAQFLGKGVSFCATCDAAFFRGQDVAIIGGGDTALDDALFLSNNCRKVYLVHRREEFRGEKFKQKAVRSRENIELVLNATVKAIEGVETVHQCVLNTPEGERRLEVSGVFVAVGLVPETSLYKGLVPTSPEGYVLAGEDCALPVAGVWAAGDIRQKPLRQIVTAAADGAVAAVAAAEYCSAIAENLFALREEGPGAP